MNMSQLNNSTALAGLRWQAVDPWSTVRMEDDSDPDPSGGGGSGSSSGEDNSPKFTQAQLNEIAAREKRDGRRAAERELAEQLGMSVDEAKALIAAQREREAAEKSELERANEEKAAKDAEARAAAAKAAAAELETKLVKALARGQAAEKSFDDALILLKSRIGDADDEEGIREAVKKLKQDQPGMFGVGSKTTPVPNGDPGSPPPTPPSGSGIDRGRERARARLGK